MRSYRKEVNMINLISKGYTAYKTYKTVKKAVAKAEELAESMNLKYESDGLMETKALREVGRVVGEEERDIIFKLIELFEG